MSERLSDLVVLIALAALLLPTSEVTLVATFVGWAAAVVVGVIALCVAVRRHAGTRRGIWALASLFNDRLRHVTVDFCWSLSECVTQGALLRPRYLLASLVMWALYLGAYALFAHAVSASLPQILQLLLGAPLHSIIGHLQGAFTPFGLALIVFNALPVLAILGYGALKQWPAIIAALDSNRSYEWQGRRSVSGGIRHRFKGEAEYQYFLSSLFSGDNKTTTTFGLNAVQDGTVHKLYSGGSDAITALVEVGDRLVIRKFAAGLAADKLRKQQQWLQAHRADALSLVEVLRGVDKDRSHYYDMPLVVPANDFYDFVHSNPVAQSQAVLASVLEQVAGLHRRQARGNADDNVVSAYLAEKGAANARLALDFARSVLPGERYDINGSAFQLGEWENLLDMGWLHRQITTRAVTDLHGDLTIENIIVAPAVGPGWYLIDPNPENIFNSELIDWAKLMQSLHLGYEGMNRSPGSVLEGSAIRLPFMRSQAYTQLHRFVEDWVLQRYGARGLREVYFHELINYLRLVPYKIRQNPRKGLAFFACTSVLLHNYMELPN